MGSTFFGINIAYSGLNAQKSAMEVLAYNVAHASDLSYKRQQVSTSERSLAGSTGGAGVVTGDIRRIRDTLVENRLRAASSESAEWQYKANFLMQVESAIGEPSDSGLQSDLSAFWNAWQAVATSPESQSVRSSLLSKASTLAEHMQYVYGQLRDAVYDLNATVVDRVNSINQLASQIAELNQQINSVEEGRMNSNDLLNARDALLGRLSELADVSQHGDGKGGYIISIGGRVLVQDNWYNALDCEVVSGNQIVTWASDGDVVLNNGGELKAIVELRDETINSYMQSLDDVASLLVSQVNAVHRLGTTLTGAPGGDFFQAGATAATIRLDAAIVDNPELVAASLDGSEGDNGNATAIANLQNAVVRDGLTLNQLYSQFITDVGSFATFSSARANACQLAVDQYTAQQQSVSGVSTDEEMTDMIKYQQAYTAAARVLTAYDEMLGTLMQTGL